MLVLHIAASCFQPLLIAADLSQDGETERVVRECIDKYHKLDILVSQGGY